jgi:hypothetical protein
MARAAVESTAAAMGAVARRCGGDGTVLEQALPRPGRSSLPTRGRGVRTGLDPSAVAVMTHQGRPLRQVIHILGCFCFASMLMAGFASKA